MVALVDSFWAARLVLGLGGLSMNGLDKEDEQVTRRNTEQGLRAPQLRSPCMGMPCSLELAVRQLGLPYGKLSIRGERGG